jgi:beta-N-acetylhexosaminidase
MLDLEGTSLTSEERELLDHPAVGGVILFSRNYADPAQLRAFTADIRAATARALLIAVDQEGGRVQRFRHGFTRFPPARTLGQLHATDAEAARAAAADLGWLLATEVREAGLDFSFAPVLDLDYGCSTVIGDRAFAAEVAAVTELAGAWMKGAQSAGMATCGKHFPGHGGVAEDSHAECPVDRRSLEELRAADLQPFQRLVAAGLDAIMPAHVVYPAVDARPAGFSAIWLKQILRGELGFQGVIFSDDLSMAAAEVAGSYPERARAALAAGCDMVILCNNRLAALAVVDALADFNDPQGAERLARLRGRDPGAGPAPEAGRERAARALARLHALRDADAVAAVG